MVYNQPVVKEEKSHNSGSCIVKDVLILLDGNVIKIAVATPPLDGDVQS